MALVAENLPLRDAVATVAPVRAAIDGEIATVRVHTSLESALPAWEALEATCPASVYQTRRYIAAWSATLGQDALPLVVVGYDRRGAPVLLLPLSLEEVGPLRIARFQGCPFTNANLGLFRPGVSLTARHMTALMRTVAQTSPHRIDAFALVNQPYAWNGADNPLALLPHQPSPSDCHGAILKVGCSDQPSRKALRRLRTKRARLAATAPVTHEIARTPDDVRAYLDAFFAQKIARLRAQGIASAYEHPLARAFFDAAASESVSHGHPSLELHALKQGERIVAIYGGGRHRSHFSCLFNSFDDTPEIARSSPGELLLQDLVAHLRSEGFESFDLGIGEARYKATWCPQDIPLFDQFIPMSTAGRVYALIAGLEGRLKRSIKRSAVLWRIAGRLRRL